MHEILALAKLGPKLVIVAVLRVINMALNPDDESRYLAGIKQYASDIKHDEARAALLAPTFTALVAEAEARGIMREIAPKLGHTFFYEAQIEILKQKLESEDSTPIDPWTFDKELDSRVWTMMENSRSFSEEQRGALQEANPHVNLATVIKAFDSGLCSREEAIDALSERRAYVAILKRLQEACGN